MKRVLIGLLSILGCICSSTTAITLNCTHVAGATSNATLPLFSEGKPDLVIEELYIIDHPTYDIAYRFMIKNIGETPVNLDDVSMQAVLSADNVFDIENDILAGGVRAGYGLLQPGQTYTGTFGATISLNPTSHPYLVLMVDYGQNIDESKETNNTRAIRYATGEDAQTTPVYFVDPRLKVVVEDTLRISDPTPVDMLFLTNLYAHNKRISDLSGLEYARNLSSLNLSINFVSDLSPLSQLTHLSVLDLRRNQISDLSPLSQLTNLTELLLFDNQISDLSALSLLMNLSVLELGVNQISDLSTLSPLTNLNFLDLQANQVSDLSPLSPLTNLTELRLHNNQISDLSALSPLTNLTDLGLVGNIILNLSPLAQLTNLTDLGLSANQISDLSPLSQLKSLAVLELGMNQISDLSLLSQLTNLTELSLFINQISDLSALSMLTNLSSLDLEGNQISDLSPLSTLTNLTGLKLHNNQISDLSPLSTLTNLTELDLSNNKISDISPLSQLTSLNRLSLGYNQIFDLSPLSVLLDLTELQLFNNQVADMSALTQLTNLTLLYLNRNPLSCTAYCNDVPNIWSKNLYLSIFEYDPPPSDCVCETPSERVLFVDARANMGQDGSSWDQAFKYLQDALAVSTSGDEIRVAQGKYRPDHGLGITPGDRSVSFRIRSGVTLKGGYAGLKEGNNTSGMATDPNQRDTERFETVLSGDLASNDNPDWCGDRHDPSRQDNSECVVSIAYADNTTMLDGLTITAGHTLTGYGGGITNSGAPLSRSITLINCVLFSNYAERGGGLKCSASNLVSCKFINNHSLHYGGAIYASLVKANSCLFYDNSAVFNGGGVYAYGDSEYSDCIFAGNAARVAGALHHVRLDFSGQIDPYNGIHTQVITFDDVLIQKNFAAPYEPNSAYIRKSIIHLLGDLDLKDGRFDISSVLIKGNGSFNIADQVVLRIIGGIDSYPTIIRSTIHGPGNIEIDQGTQFILDGNCTVNLSGSGICNPDSNEGGLIKVDGSLVVRGNATLRNTNVEVTLFDINTPSDIQYNNITLKEASAGFGGEFFVAGNATISCNTIISEGDRYLDLDPDPQVEQKPTITQNQITVIIKEGALSSQGTLLELRAKDYDFNSFGTSGAHLVRDSTGFTKDPSENWVLEKLILEPDSKLNLTNRQGFEFQDISEPYPETVYVKELVMGPNSVLNTGLQTLYYQRLLDTDGNDLERTSFSRFEKLDNGAQFTDIPLLGFSLGIIAMNNQMEFDVRVRKDPININSTDPNDQYIRRLDGIDAIPSGAGGIMEMRTWISDDEHADVVTAKGAFARAGDEDITIKFEYMFPDEDPGDAYIVVYLSDHHEVNHASRIPVAVIYPPDLGRPGSWNSHRFAVFSITIPRGHLNFTHGTYVELGLHGHDVRCWIDNWDPRVSCTAVCGDYDSKWGVTISDYLLLLAEYGLSNLPVNKNCLDIFPDDCINVDDLTIWDTPGILTLCLEREQNLAMMNGHFSEHALFSGSPEDSIQATGLVLYGKKGTGYWEYDGYVYDLDTNGTCLRSQATGGRGRLITNKINGSLYQIQSNTGLVHIKGPGNGIEQRKKLSYPNSTKTLSVGFNDSYKDGVPLMDAVFHPLDSDVVYVVPVLVRDLNNTTYPAAAKLRLNQATGNPYTVEAVYGLDPAEDPSPGIVVLAPDANDQVLEPDFQHVKEIEINRSGSYVYLLSSHVQNENNWLLVYKEETGDLIKAFNFNDPCDISDPYGLLADVNAPSALVVSTDSGNSPQCDRFYITSSERSVHEHEDLTVKIFSFLLDVDSLATEPNTTLLEFDRAIEINCNGLEPDPNLLDEYNGLYDPNRHVSVITSMTEDPNGTLYVVGFTAPRFHDDRDWGKQKTYFTTPFLAVVESSSVIASAQPIDGIALPLSVSWCGFTHEDSVDAVLRKDTNLVAIAQISSLADHWLESMRGAGLARLNR